MNAKQKEILQVQRSLLSRNIVWSPALAYSLKANHLLTDSMVAQIEAAQGAENKILVMLDLLPLRTSQVYDKFADALHLSGHTLLADFLREEDLSKQPLNVKDLFKRLPFLSKNMKDVEKKQVEAYMSEKIQSAILSHTWQWDTKEKDKALVAKQEQLEQAHVHEQEMKKKQEQLQEVQKQLKDTREECMGLKAELRALSDNSSRVQQQMRGQMDTQMRFSMANDSIAQRTGQRLQTAEAILRAVQDKLGRVVNLSPRDQEKEQMRLAENPFAFLPEDVDLFLGQFRQLLVVRLKCEELLEEKNYILNHLGLPQEKIDDDHEHGTLLKAFQEFVSKNDAQTASLKAEVARYKGLLEEISRGKLEEEKKMAAAGTVWQNAIMSVMRKQLQDLKSSMRKKDSSVEIKDAEISKLRSRVNELEAALKAHQADLATQAVTLHDLRNGHASSLDGSVSPFPNNNGQSLPPLKPSATTAAATAASQKTSASPRAGGAANNSRASKPPPHAPVSRSIVVHTAAAATPLGMYPAGLTTMQLRVDHGPHPRAGPPPSTADPRGGRPPMGSTLGDLRAMHSRYPGVSRGGGMGGGGGGGGSQGFSGGAGGGAGDVTTMTTSSSAPSPMGKGISSSSPAARRKTLAAKVK